MVILPYLAITFIALVSVHRQIGLWVGNITSSNSGHPSADNIFNSYGDLFEIRFRNIFLIFITNYLYQKSLIVVWHSAQGVLNKWRQLE